MVVGRGQQPCGPGLDPIKKKRARFVRPLVDPTRLGWVRSS